MNNLMRVFSNENFAKAENAINAIIDENKKANLLEIYNTMKFIKIEYRKMNEHTGYVGQITPRAIAELIANLNSTLPEDKKAVIEKIVEIGKCKAKIRTANLNEMQKETNRIFNDESRVDSEHGYLDVEKESTSSDNHNNIMSHAEMVDMLVRDMENGVRDAHGEPIQKEAQEESHGMGMAAFTSLTTIALLSALSAIQIIILGVLFTR